MKSTVAMIKSLLAVILVSLAVVNLELSSSSAQIEPVTSQGTAQPDMVLVWNEHAANAILTAGQPGTRGFISLAMAHVAVYEAVNAISGYRFNPYALRPNVVFPASPEAAAAAAAHETLLALFPTQQADLDAKYAASLATIPEGPAKANGVAVGQQTAAGILALRANDGRNAVVPYTPGSGPGVWQPTPPPLLPALTPEFAQVRSWTRARSLRSPVARPPCAQPRSDQCFQSVTAMPQTTVAPVREVTAVQEKGFTRG